MRLVYDDSLLIGILIHLRLQFASRPVGLSINRVAHPEADRVGGIALHASNSVGMASQVHPFYPTTWCLPGGKVCVRIGTKEDNQVIGVELLGNPTHICGGRSIVLFFTECVTPEVDNRNFSGDPAPTVSSFQPVN